MKKAEKETYQAMFKTLTKCTPCNSDYPMLQINADIFWGYHTVTPLTDQANTVKSSVQEFCVRKFLLEEVKRDEKKSTTNNFLNKYIEQSTNCTAIHSR